MTPRQSNVLLLHAAATLFMTGLIWFVQVVHYPLFSEIGVDAFARYATVHSVRTAWVVVPVMLVEMATALWLAFAPPSVAPRAASVTALASLTAIWLSTLFVQVPHHVSLGSGFDAGTVTALVATNWVRTVGWSVRSAIVLAVLSRALRPIPPSRSAD